MRLEDAMADHMQDLRRRVERALRSISLLSPENQVRRARERMVALRQRLLQTGGTTIERFRARHRTLAAQLSALSPVAILSRGYALAWKMPERALVRDAGQLAAGDTLSLLFGKGGATASVQSIEETADGRTEV
jgi:exodeoxyribonuclease VII large subunit